jgi:hypothetical protein
LKRIKLLVLFFIFALLLSGITAFPVYSELCWLRDHGWMDGENFSAAWLKKVYEGISFTHSNYPFLFYGYDWLAFAHLVIAALFYGVYKNPVRNKFIIDWGIFCCIAVIPLAFICGSIRGIPFFHILIDCSFGVIGIIPLLLCRRYIAKFEQLQSIEPS